MQNTGGKKVFDYIPILFISTEASSRGPQSSFLKQIKVKKRDKILYET